MLLNDMEKIYGDIKKAITRAASAQKSHVSTPDERAAAKATRDSLGAIGGEMRKAIAREKQRRLAAETPSNDGKAESDICPLHKDLYVQGSGDEIGGSVYN